MTNIVKSICNWGLRPYGTYRPYDMLTNAERIIFVISVIMLAISIIAIFSEAIIHILYYKLKLARNKFTKSIIRCEIGIWACAVLFFIIGTTLGCMMMPSPEDDTQTFQSKTQIVKVSHVKTLSNTYSFIKTYKLEQSNDGVTKPIQISSKSYNYRIILNKSNGTLIKTDD